MFLAIFSPLILYAMTKYSLSRLMHSLPGAERMRGGFGNIMDIISLQSASDNHQEPEPTKMTSWDYSSSSSQLGHPKQQ
jgi:hypothetical protein